MQDNVLRSYLIYFGGKGIVASFWGGGGGGGGWNMLLLDTEVSSLGVGTQSSFE